MEVIGKTLDDANRKAFLYGDGKAWDNRKHKIYLRYTPRGKVYSRLRRQEWKSYAKEFNVFINSYEPLVARLLEEVMDTYG